MDAAPPRTLAQALAASGPWFAGLLVVAGIAFWPTYLSRLQASSAYVHLHAATATLWMVLLVAQPLAIRAGRRDLHRALGRTAWVLAPVVLLAMLLLAHNRFQGLEPRHFTDQAYTLYLQLSLAAVWALSCGLALYWRRRTPLHARLMVCTGLTLIDPIAARLGFMVAPGITWNFQWFTFGLTDAVIVALIFLDRRSPSGRGVFPAMLAVFVAAQAPALAGLAGTPAWLAFARWFAALPLT